MRGLLSSGQPLKRGQPKQAFSVVCLADNGALRDQKGPVVCPGGTGALPPSTSSQKLGYYSQSFSSILNT
ncbi:hypothetical protein FS842_002343 [Serendipita sp. 407]|nr:hypothetical protein FS842_002343 [Serendipita sp. 407]